MPTPAVNPLNAFQTPAAVTHQALDPALLRFAAAMVIAAIVVEVVRSFNESAAWILVLLFILGGVIKNPLVWSYLALGAKEINAGVSN